MEARKYLNKHIVGQTRIKRELSILLEEMKYNSTNYNLLFTGSSGYGKTYLCTIIGNYININDTTQTTLGDDFELENFNEYLKYRIQFIDEVHRYDQEFLYPYLVSRKNIFLFATNYFDKLLEPFVNRCIHFKMDEYKLSEIVKIMKPIFIKSKTILDVDFIRYLAESSRSNPRIAKQLAEKISIYIKQNGKIESIGTFSDILKSVYGILPGGFTQDDIRYLEFLKNNNRSSLGLISNTLDISIETITKFIEPFLVKSNLIQITSRGRILK